MNAIEPDELLAEQKRLTDAIAAQQADMGRKSLGRPTPSSASVMLMNLNRQACRRDDEDQDAGSESEGGIAMHRLKTWMAGSSPAMTPLEMQPEV